MYNELKQIVANKLGSKFVCVDDCPTDFFGVMAELFLMTDGQKIQEDIEKLIERFTDDLHENRYGVVWFDGCGGRKPLVWWKGMQEMIDYIDGQLPEEYDDFLEMLGQFVVYDFVKMETISNEVCQFLIARREKENR